MSSEDDFQGFLNEKEFNSFMAKNGVLVFYNTFLAPLFLIAQTSLIIDIYHKETIRRIPKSLYLLAVTVLSWVITGIIIVILSPVKVTDDYISQYKIYSGDAFVSFILAVWTINVLKEPYNISKQYSNVYIYSGITCAILSFIQLTFSLKLFGTKSMRSKMNKVIEVSSTINVGGQSFEQIQTTLANLLTNRKNSYSYNKHVI